MKRELNKLRNLMILVFIAWTAVFIIASIVMVKLREDDVRELISSRLLDSMEALRFSADTRKTVDSVCDAEAIGKCRALCYLLELRKGKNIDQEVLNRIAASMAIREYTISNEKGIVEFSNKPVNLGYDLHLHEQSRAFLPAMNNPDFEYLQPSGPRSDGKIYKYVGKARRDKPGLIQVVYDTEYIRKVNDIGDIRKIMPMLKIGAEGFILIARENVVITAENQDLNGCRLRDLGITVPMREGAFFSVTVSGTDYLACFEKFEDLQLIGLVPKTEITDVVTICIVTFLIETVVAALLILFLIFQLRRKMPDIRLS